MKTNGRLAGCSLRGTMGDAVFAVLCGCGHKHRKIISHLWALLAQIIAAILTLFRAVLDRQSAYATA